MDMGHYFQIGLWRDSLGFCVFPSKQWFNRSSSVRGVYRFFNFSVSLRSRLDTFIFLWNGFDWYAFLVFFPSIQKERALLKGLPSFSSFSLSFSLFFAILMGCCTRKLLSICFKASNQLCEIPFSLLPSLQNLWYSGHLGKAIILRQGQKEL